MSRERAPVRHLCNGGGTLTVSGGPIAASLARFGPSMAGPLEFRGDGAASAQLTDPPLTVMPDPTLIGRIAPASRARGHGQN